MGEDIKVGKNVGIITFHHSYNCGSMLQAYALQTVVERLGFRTHILNFSNEGQRRLYSVLFPLNSPKNVLKDLILLPRRSRIARNFEAYELFIAKRLHVDGPVVSDPADLTDKGFDTIITGSDQVWNVTIEDGDDAYFLPWAKNVRRVAYAPSFGARNPAVFADDPRRYASYLQGFDALSIRERNGQRWIRELAGLDVPVLLDPTLLLDSTDYADIEETMPGLPEHYLFYYSPGYSRDINRLVENVAKKTGLPVVAFNAKSYYMKGMNLTSSFLLPAVESPATYLALIKNADVVFTTSFHGTIFSSVYRKPFWTVKNGGMFGDDDRVLTLVDTLGIDQRLCPIEYDDSVDYLSMPDWTVYEQRLGAERERSLEWLAAALG